MRGAGCPEGGGEQHAKENFDSVLGQVEPGLAGECEWCSPRGKRGQAGRPLGGDAPRPLHCLAMKIAAAAITKQAITAKSACSTTAAVRSRPNMPRTVSSGPGAP